ncbi:MAG: RsmB/NOP family class I SAM-dependent RNA methyltransferase, partial [Crocinitomicaceae bacterium]|nr:RsmB/NOP family class I SAM-dependent RNA methyltransferase [Crocinitomicaceae bacterium]
MNDTPLPFEFISRIRTQFSDEAEEFITSLDNPPCTSIHIHPYKSSSLIWAGEKIPWFENGLIIKERPVFTLDPSFHAGAYYPQESSSMFIGYLTEQLFGSNKNITCLDFCAAPGGKSLVISDFIGTEGRIVSNEIHKVRNSILRENLIKWGVSNFIITQSHSEIFRKVPSFFDLVLVDAPCSGEGMFRKDINARSEWSPETIRVCSLRQKEILSDLIESIKPGGYLIYSTCTFAPDENEKNAEWMLTQGMLPVTLSVPSGWNIRQIGQPSFCGFQFLPHRVAGEGFFAVVFRKDEASQRKRIPKTGKRPYRRALEKKEKLLLSDWVNTPDKLLI